MALAKKQEKAGFVYKQKQNEMKKSRIKSKKVEKKCFNWKSVVSEATIVGATRCDAKIKWKDRIKICKVQICIDY